MEKEDMKIWNIYFYNWFEMEYMWLYWYNYLFRIEFIDDRIAQEIWSLEHIYSSKKEMMIAMYGDTIKKEIDKLEELRKDRKEYKEIIIEELQKTAKSLWDNAIIGSVLQNQNLEISIALASRIREYVDTFIEKFIKNQ